MHVENLYRAISSSYSANLDQTAKLVWQSFASGLIEEQEAGALGAAIEARRRALASIRTHPTVKCSKASQRAPVGQGRAICIGRRRGLAASGAVPGKIAAHFTTGELAALTVIARQCQRRGNCVMFMDQIAAIAGVGRTTARNAIRQAQRLGLIDMQERRISGNRSDSNVIRITSSEWLAWLRIGNTGGGCKKPAPTSNHSYSSPAKAAPSSPRKHQTATKRPEGPPDGRSRQPHRA